MLIVSYVTTNSPYETVLQNCLMPGIKQFNLPHDIEYIDNLGSWDKNTQYKVNHIHKMLLKHNQPVCFLDADACIVKYPELLFNLGETWDFAFFTLDWQYHWRGKPGNNFHLLSGTLAVNNTDMAFKVLYNWAMAIPLSPGLIEQKVLQNVIQNTPRVKCVALPAEYCCVTMQDGSLPKYIDSPIIIHTQASRTHRYWMQ